VPKTVQIRDIDDDLYLALTQRAAEYGISVPELLRREAEKLVRKPSMKQWLERTRNRSTPISRNDVLEALDEMRGPWPDADR
jgi:hypothetical protein